MNQDVLKSISEIFIGDEEELYSYKTGPQIIRFFNGYFNYNDIYSDGFPTRWKFTVNKLIELNNNNKLDKFIEKILSIEYIMHDRSVSNSEAFEIRDSIRNKFNDIFVVVSKKVVISDDKVSIINLRDDLELIGEGGFANVYKIKGKMLAIKILKDEFKNDKGIKSRFKREFNLIKTLNHSNVLGVIEVFEFNDSDCSYTMELADCTFEEYILRNPNSESKINAITSIIYTMSQVHKCNNIHRDLCPNNILIISGKLKISDFGFGKDLELNHSHKTNVTTIAKHRYSAPELFYELKPATMKSDVFSLGRIINFTFSSDPSIFEHPFKLISKKATSNEPSDRYLNAEELYYAVNEKSSTMLEKMSTEEIKENIEKGVCTVREAEHINMLNGKEIYCYLIDSPLSKNSFKEYCKMGDEIAYNFIDKLKTYLKEGSLNGYKYSDLDFILEFTYHQLIDGIYGFKFNECACDILLILSETYNRFNAKDRIDDIVNGELIEPVLVEKFLD